MFSIHNYKYECSKQCKNIKHSQIINAALTKHSIPDEKIASFIAKTCRNFAKISEEGSTALHIAAAANRCNIIEWLINHSANINAQTKETGETPLHKALHHGNIEAAVLLLSYGAKIDISNDKATDVLLYCDDASKMFPIISNKNEILVWGNNKNYNLGIGNVEGKMQPQHLRFFDKLKLSIKNVSLSAYHGLYLTTSGSLYVVGHGNGGRLGTGLEKTIIDPELVQLSKKEIIIISAAKDNSLVLTKDNAVYSCGANAHFQLGYQKNIDHQLTFKEVEFVNRGEKGWSQIIGLIANDFYSVAYSSKEVYVWGLNSGQFGMKTDSQFVTEPTKIPTFDYDILSVQSNNSSVVLYSPKNRKLVIYSKMKTKKIPTPDHQLIRQFTINNENLLKIAMSTEHGEIYFWYEDFNQYVRCRMSLPLNSYIHSVLWCGVNILVNSKDRLFLGEVSLRTIDLLNAQEYQTVDITKSVCNVKETYVKLQRIPYIDRITKMFCDSEGKSYVVLQEDSRRYLNVQPKEAEELHFKELFLGALLSDTMHDVVFHVDNDTYPAHKLIIFSRSDSLRSFITKSEEKHIHLNGIPSEIFSSILKFIYFGNKFSTNDIIDLKNLYSSYRSSSAYDKGSLLEQIIRELGINKLMRNQSLSSSATSPFSKLNRNSFSDLSDVTIQCCNQIEIKAHKCILFARMEYFRLMFSNRWTETKNVNLTTVPVEYMETILDYLYSSNVTSIQNGTYSDNFIINMIIICDQYFIADLKYLFEYLLIDRISLKKCTDILSFSLAYNCTTIETMCIDFIIQNMSRVLECRILEGLEKDILNKITLAYRQRFGKDICPISSSAVNDHILNENIENFSVDLTYKFLKKNKEKESKLAHHKKQREKASLKLLDDKIADEYTNETDNNRYKREICEITNQFQSQCNIWTKLLDKKSLKHVPIVPNLFQSSHSDDKFEVLYKKKTEASDPVDNIDSNPKKNYFNLSELLAKSESSYLNAKQSRYRKNAILFENEGKPRVNDEQVKNNSFVEMIKSPQSDGFLATSPINTFPQFNSDHLFTEIVADEKRKRTYNDKIKTKSLYLTQIEETAISEIEEFYNVKELYDEKIHITRKSFF